MQRRKAKNEAFQPKIQSGMFSSRCPSFAPQPCTQTRMKIGSDRKVNTKQNERHRKENENERKRNERSKERRNETQQNGTERTKNMLGYSPPSLPLPSPSVVSTSSGWYTIIRDESTARVDLPSRAEIHESRRRRHSEVRIHVVRV